MSASFYEIQERLGELAKAATQGNWRQGSVEKHHVFVDEPREQLLGNERVLLRMNAHYPYEHDAAFIAAADPGTVLLLLAEIGRLRAERDDARRQLVAAMQTIEAGATQTARAEQPGEIDEFGEGGHP